MLTIVLGALLGLFGNGPLGLATAADEAGILEVEYNRFARYGADLTLTVQVREEAATQGGFEVWVATDYLEGVSIDDVRPAPDASEVSSGGILYTFLADRGDLEAVFRAIREGRCRRRVAIPLSAVERLMGQRA